MILLNLYRLCNVMHSPLCREELPIVLEAVKEYGPITFGNLGEYLFKSRSFAERISKILGGVELVDIIESVEDSKMKHKVKINDKGLAHLEGKSKEFGDITRVLSEALEKAKMEETARRCRIFCEDKYGFDLPKPGSIEDMANVMGRFCDILDMGDKEKNDNS